MKNLTLEEIKELVKNWDVPLESKIKQFLYKQPDQEASEQKIIKHFESDNTHNEIQKALICALEEGDVDIVRRKKKIYYKPSARGLMILE